MAYFHCQTRIQIQTRTQIPNPMATWYYGLIYSTDSDSDLYLFPMIFVWYRNPSPNPNPSPALEISHRISTDSLVQIMQHSPMKLVKCLCFVYTIFFGTHDDVSMVVISCVVMYFVVTDTVMLPR